MQQKKSKKGKIIIVTQDTYLIQTYSGFWGKLFKKLYLNLLSWRLKILLGFLSKKTIILLTSESLTCQEGKLKKIFFYSQEINKIDIGKYRKQSLKIVKEFSKVLSRADFKNSTYKSIKIFDIWKSQTSVRLSYHYFPYREVIEEIVKKNKPKEVWVMGASTEEKIASKIAKENNIIFNKFALLDFSSIYNFLSKYLFKRQLARKAKFFTQSPQIVRQEKAYSKKNAYLLSVDFFRHLKTLVPIYKKLKEKGKKVFFVSDSANLKQILKNIYKIDQDDFSLTDFIPAILFERKLINYRKNFNLVWQKLLTEKGEIFQIMNDYFEIVVKEVLPIAKIYLEAAEILIDKIQPRVILTVNNVRFMENALILMAKKKKIPNLTAHQAMILSSDKTTQFRADFFCAVGDYIKKELIEIGYLSSRIIVCGDPQLDFLQNRSLLDKKNIFARLGLDLGKKIVLLISDRPNPRLSYEEKKEQFQKTANALQHLSNVQLIVKPHPTEERQTLMADLKNWGIRNCLVSDNNKIELFELLEVSSLVVIGWSMVGFEAMLMGRPVIVANFNNKNYDLKIPYVKKASALKVTKVEQMTTLIKLLISEKSQLRKKQIEKGLRFCSKYYLLPIGGSAERIYQLLKSF